MEAYTRSSTLAPELKEDEEEDEDDEEDEDGFITSEGEGLNNR